MRISVAVPVYNHVKHTEHFLRDFAEFDSPDRELIIIDNASTDTTPEVVQDFQSCLEHLVYVRNDVNKGVPASYNQGIQCATGDFVFVCNNDVRLYADVFEQMVFRLMLAPRSLIGPQLVQDGNSRNMPYLVGWLIGATRAIWTELGGFDEAFGLGYYEDVDLCVRAVRTGIRLAQAQGLGAQHIQGVTMTGGNFDWRAQTRASRDRFWKKYEEEQHG